MTILVRATHRYGFRSGEWAEITGLAWVNERPCFEVRFIDGARDKWPVYDPSDPYEFRVGRGGMEATARSAAGGELVDEKAL